MNSKCTNSIADSFPPQINHFGYAGARALSRPVGSSTGNKTIALAWQMWFNPLTLVTGHWRIPMSQFDHASRMRATPRFLHMRASRRIARNETYHTLVSNIQG